MQTAHCVELEWTCVALCRIPTKVRSTTSNDIACLLAVFKRRQYTQTSDAPEGYAKFQFWCLAWETKRRPSP